MISKNKVITIYFVLYFFLTFLFTQFFAFISWQNFQNLEGNFHKNIIAGSTWFIIYFLLITTWIIISYKLYYKNIKLSDKFFICKLISFLFIIRILYLFMSPALSDDYFRYLWDGNLSYNNINPYKSTPTQAINKYTILSNDEFATLLYKKMNSPDYYTCYPPCSQYIFKFSIHILKLININKDKMNTVGFYVLKFIYGLFELLTLTAILYTLKILKTNHKSFVFIFSYAACPLLLLETWGQAHSEIVAICALSLFIIFILKHKLYTSSFFLSAAIWTKLSPILLVPAFLIYVYKLKFKVKNVILSTLIIILSTALFWSVFNIISLEEIKIIYNNFSTSLALWFEKFEFNNFYNNTFNTLITNIFQNTEIKNIIIKSTPITILLTYFTYLIFKKPKHLFTYFINSIIFIYTIYFLFSRVLHPWYFLIWLYLIVIILPLYFTKMEKTFYNKIYLYLTFYFFTCAILSPITYIRYFKCFSIIYDNQNLYKISIYIVWVLPIIFFISRKKITKILS